MSCRRADSQPATRPRYLPFFPEEGLVDSLTVVLGWRLTVDCLTNLPVDADRPRFPATSTSDPSGKIRPSERYCRPSLQPSRLDYERHQVAVSEGVSGEAELSEKVGDGLLASVSRTGASATGSACADSKARRRAA